MRDSGDRTIPDGTPFEPLGDSGQPGEPTELSEGNELLPIEAVRIPGVTLIREIGGGGMGIVYLGRQEYLDRDVAVKLLNPDRQGRNFERRFRREAKILAGMRHENIVGCYQAGMTLERACFLVMEYIDGPDLSQWLERNGAMTETQALSVCRDVAKALGHAHGCDIIHRDVKPGNVLLQKDERAAPGDPFPYVVKLADLGLARSSGHESSADFNITMPGAMLGTPSTMAPEQFEDPDNVDYRADVYGLGCVLFHALTGRVAYSETTIGSIIASKLRLPPPDPSRLRPGIDRGVSKLVQRMLNPDRERRPQTYTEIAESCERLLERSGSGRTRSSPLARVGAAAAAVLIAVVAWFAFSGGEEAEPEGVRAAEVDPQLEEPVDPPGDSTDDREEANRTPTFDETFLAAFEAARSAFPATIEETESFDLPAIELPGGLSLAWEAVEPAGLVLDDGVCTPPEAGQDYEAVLRLTLSTDSGDVRAKVVSFTVQADDDLPRIARILVAGEEVDSLGVLEEPEGKSARVAVSAEATDAEGDELAFAWEIVGEAPQGVNFTDADSPTATLTLVNAQAPYEVDCRLLVREANASASTARTVEEFRVDVQADDDPPVVRRLLVGSVELSDGSRVTEGDEVVVSVEAEDPEGETLAFRWELDPAAAGAMSENANIRFTSPEATADYTIEVSVVAEEADGANAAEPVVGSLTVVADDDPPRIDSVVLSSTTAEPGDPIEVVATASDPDSAELRFTWSLPEGAEVVSEESSAFASTLVFKAPGLASVVPTVTVYDGTTEVPGTADPVAIKLPPAATAKPVDAPVTEGELVTLTALDVQEDLAYSWHQVGEGPVALDEAHEGPTVSFRAPDCTTGDSYELAFRLEVREDGGAPGVDTVQIRVDADPAFVPAPSEPTELFTVSDEVAEVFQGWTLTADGKAVALDSEGIDRPYSGFYSDLVHEWPAYLWGNAGKQDQYVSLSGVRSLPRGPWRLDGQLMIERIRPNPDLPGEEGLPPSWGGGGIWLEYADGSAIVLGVGGPDADTVGLVAYRISVEDDRRVIASGSMRELATLKEFEITHLSVSWRDGGIHVGWATGIDPRREDTDGQDFELSSRDFPRRIRVFAHAARARFRNFELGRP